MISMRAAMIHETGGPEVLGIEEVERPEPAEGEALVRVCAASVNPIDWKLRKGFREMPLPALLGNDVSGVVELSRAPGFAAGDEVFGIAAEGAYAEYVTVGAEAIVAKPAAIGHEQAAAIPVSGMTAWQALFDHGGLQSGQTALVAGAAGGVGHFAVQLAKHAGARVIGTGSARNREFVLSLGADEFLDYTRVDVAETASDVDVAFDTVGGATTEPLLSTLRPGGVLVTIANAPPVDAASALGVRAALMSMDIHAEQLAEIAELVASGAVRVEIASTFPLADVAQAHALSEAGHTRGKLILAIAAS
jgi:NADPH:quinone reductase-like Zn-dependent oxidoreductase